MKRIIIVNIIISFISTATPVPPEQQWLFDQYTSIPVQATACDYIGKGHVIFQNKTNILFHFDNNWLNTETNFTMNVFHYNLSLPTNEIVLFAMKRDFIDESFSEDGYIGMLRTDRFKPALTQDPLYLIGYERSWIDVTTENQSLINWASNLVVYSQINLNTNRFYELLCDGANLYPTNSRIHKDFVYALSNARYYLSRDYWHDKYQNDTNLTGFAKAAFEEGAPYTMIIHVNETSNIVIRPQY